jgi:16S rRNA (cytosine967-C5)-methyltransferase
MPRHLAYEVLRRVEEEDAFSNRALDAELAEAELEDRDRRLATRLVYGVLTWRRALDSLLDDLVHGGISKLDAEVLRILRMGAYQLLFLDRVPDHAVVDEASDMTETYANRGAVSLVNAVLREATRLEEPTWWDDEDRERKPVRYLGERYSLPNWIANRMIQLFGAERAEQLGECLTRQPPIHLRMLGGEEPAGLAAEEEQLTVVDEVPGAVRAERVSETVDAAIADRRCIIQDLGSQLVARYVGIEPGMSVLDGCAGLGGKTFALADEAGADARVLAVDSIKWKVDKLARLADQASLGARIETRSGRLQELDLEGGEPFDRVLVDAPCSALGVMRRHPEIKWKRDESDIPSLVDLQASLLDAAARFVAPGGVLVFSVCTFMSEEGPKQVAGFLDEHDEFELAGPPTDEQLDWSSYIDEQGRLSLNPVDHDTDLFFAARLRRCND